MRQFFHQKQLELPLLVVGHRSPEEPTSTTVDFYPNLFKNHRPVDILQIEIVVVLTRFHESTVDAAPNITWPVFTLIIQNFPLGRAQKRMDQQTED